MPIRSICSENLIAINKSNNIRQAADLMRQHHVGSLIVSKGPPTSRFKAVGILTDRDIVLEVIAKGKDPKDVSVADVMTRNPVTVAEGAGIYEALKVMERSGVKRLLLVDQEDDVVGIVSTDDILELLAEELSELSTLGRRQVSQEMETRA